MVDLEIQRNRLSDGYCPAPIGAGLLGRIVFCSGIATYGRVGCKIHLEQLPTQLRDRLANTNTVDHLLSGEYEHWRNQAMVYWATGIWNGSSYDT